MGILNLFKKNPKPANDVLLCMPMFNNNEAYSLVQVVDYLTSHWKCNVTNVEGDDSSAVLTVDGDNIALAFMAYPIPSDDITGAARYAYNWPTAIEDINEHTGHAILANLGSDNNTVHRFSTSSKVTDAILATTNAVGVYNGGQSLLTPVKQYREATAVLKQERLPVSLWIYFGLRTTDTGNSAYTYGLKAFSKNEMEIIDSNKSLEELYEYLYDITDYVIANNITFKSNETLGRSADEKITITLSKGCFVDGESFKLGF